MSRVSAVRLTTLARELTLLVEQGYGNCSVYVETRRDVGKLSSLAFRRRGGAFFLCETDASWTDATIRPLAETDANEQHQEKKETLSNG